MTHPRLTSSLFSRAISISILLLAALTASAQEQRKKMVQQPDTIPLLRGVSVSADLVGLGQMLWSDYGQYEAALRVNLKDKYFPIVEIGIGKADADDVTTKLTYKTSAPYGRIGMDFNVMKNKHDDYRVYVGFRYGFATFKFDVAGPPLSDPVYGGEAPFSYTDNKSTWHWLEGAAGVDARIWGPVRLGWSVRYRRRITASNPEIGQPWYVPGFGKAGGSRLGGTFNVILEI